MNDVEENVRAASAGMARDLLRVSKRNQDRQPPGDEHLGCGAGNEDSRATGEGAAGRCLCGIRKCAGGRGTEHGEWSWREVKRWNEM